jgi:Cyclic nucleotide-binding domain
LNSILTPSLDGIKFILDFLAEQRPAQNEKHPADFVNLSFLKKLEKKCSSKNFPAASHNRPQRCGGGPFDMNEQYAGLITGFPLFKGFTLDGAKMLLDSGEVKEFSPGEMLIKEGDEPAFVLLVLTGKLEVFVQRQQRDLILTDAGPGTILGELAVLCAIPRSASVRAREKSTVLQWGAAAFRSLLLRDGFFSQRIFRESLRTLIEKERSLIDSLIRSQGSAE